MLAELVILLLSVLALYLMSRKDPDRLLNIYSQPGKNNNSCIYLFNKYIMIHIVTCFKNYRKSSTCILQFDLNISEFTNLQIVYNL